MQEEIIESPITHTPLCYKVTQNNFISYLDYSSGFFSNSLMVDKSEYQAEWEETAPEIVKDLKFVEYKTKLAWYPMIVKKEDFTIFPEGTKEKYTWCVVPFFKDDKNSIKPDWDKKQNFENYLAAVSYADDIMNQKNPSKIE